MLPAPPLLAATGWLGGYAVALASHTLRRPFTLSHQAAFGLCFLLPHVLIFGFSPNCTLLSQTHRSLPPGFLIRLHASVFLSPVSVCFYLCCGLLFVGVSCLLFYAPLAFVLGDPACLSLAVPCFCTLVAVTQFLFCLRKAWLNSLTFRLARIQRSATAW